MTDKIIDIATIVLAIIAVIMVFVSCTNAQHITINEVVWGTEYTLFVPDEMACYEKHAIVRELRRLTREIQGEMCNVTIRNNPNVLPFTSNGR